MPVINALILIKADFRNWIKIAGQNEWQITACLINPNGRQFAQFKQFEKNLRFWRCDSLIPSATFSFGLRRALAYAVEYVAYMINYVLEFAELFFSCLWSLWSF